MPPRVGVISDDLRSDDPPSFRPRTLKSLVPAAATIAATIALLHYYPDQDDGSGAMLGGIGAFFGALLGLAAVARTRPLPRRDASQHTRLAVLAVGAGAAVGIANLLANYGLSLLDPAIREQMVTRWAAFSTWSVVLAEPVMEEVVYRLGLLGGLAWITSRFTSDRRTIFHVALGVSAVIFGVAHIFYGGVEHPAYAVGMAVKSSAGGAAFGWVFWRWGLPYSMACHCVANAIHLLLMPAVFRGLA